jgi:CRISPR-associated protein Cmr3
LAQQLRGARRLRLQLATPAIFAAGWRPGWLNEALQGAPPLLPGLTLQLVGAAVPRREAVSGWDYQARGPKRVRWMAPAGSVYFFEVTGGDAGAVAKTLWLEPVSDDAQDCRDGYGLALWGIWSDGGGSG